MIHEDFFRCKWRKMQIYSMHCLSPSNSLTLYVHEPLRKCSLAVGNIIIKFYNSSLFSGSRNETAKYKDKPARPRIHMHDKALHNVLCKNTCEIRNLQMQICKSALWAIIIISETRVFQCNWPTMRIFSQSKSLFASFHSEIETWF